MLTPSGAPNVERARRSFRGAHAVRTVFATRKSARKLLWSARSARAVFPTTNERKEARAAREPHNNSVREEHLWSARSARAVFPTTNERLLMPHPGRYLGRIRRCLCVGRKARRPGPAGRSAVSLRAASAWLPAARTSTRTAVVSPLSSQDTKHQTPDTRHQTRTAHA